MPREVARQACDTCRVKRAKCAFANPISPHPGTPSETNQCQRCLNLGVPCTFLLPVKTRGPRRKQGLGLAQHSGSLRQSPSVSSSPTFDIHSTSESSHSITGGEPEDTPKSSTLQGPRWATRGSPSTPTEPWHYPGTLGQTASPYDFVPDRALSDTSFPTDRLCSRELLQCILNDYLDLLYPLIPIVHRPSFRRDLAQTREGYDTDFLGLLLALCAVTVGTIPSRFRAYRTHHNPIRFQTRTEMISFCHDMMLQLRGTEYFDQINLTKWAISYLFTVAFFQIGNHNKSRMVEVEAMQLARLLDLHQISSYEGFNCIETQLRKKAFWLMFYGYVHAQLQNLRKERLTFIDSTMLVGINLADLMPIEVDDEMIYEDKIVPQPPAELSITTGFNANSRVFWASLISVASNDSPRSKEQYCNCVRSAVPSLQIEHLRARLHDLKYLLDGVPAELRQWSVGTQIDEFESSAEQYRKKVLKGQFEAMRANIHVTNLWLRSIIMDELDALQDTDSRRHSSGTSPPAYTTQWSEREDICRQLLHVLYSVSEDHVEPNGHYLTYKVRDVAVTLLACPFGPEDGASIRANEYLREFTSILSRLDESEKVNTLSLQSWVDTDRRPRGDFP